MNDPIGVAAFIIVVSICVLIAFLVLPKEVKATTAARESGQRLRAKIARWNIGIEARNDREFGKR